MSLDHQEAYGNRGKEIVNNRPLSNASNIRNHSHRSMNVHHDISYSPQVMEQHAKRVATFEALWPHLI